MSMQTRKRKRDEAETAEKEVVNVRVDIMARLHDRLLQEVEDSQSTHFVEYMKYF
jgi:two-component sensor histidine kinase